MKGKTIVTTFDFGFHSKCCFMLLPWLVIAVTLMPAEVLAYVPKVVDVSDNETSIDGEIYENSDNVCITFKNISKNELNISGEELTERFVRGDSSRNTEGSGLGLSIAKNLTDLQGGKLSIDIDGDLFKATVIFKGIK